MTVYQSINFFYNISFHYIQFEIKNNIFNDRENKPSIQLQHKIKRVS